MEISKRTLRRVENISDICDFDTEKGVATLHLYFDKAEEILDKQQSTPVRPVISAETIERMSRNMCIIPEEFDVVYAITVDDYQDYTPDQLLHAYKTGLENRYYRKDEENRTDHAVWFLFALVGLALLVFCLLYTPCVVVIASIKRELGRGWAAGVVLWQCLVAWIMAMLTFVILGGIL